VRFSQKEKFQIPNSKKKWFQRLSVAKSEKKEI
jgi:hypothetical protein